MRRSPLTGLLDLDQPGRLAAVQRAHRGDEVEGERRRHREQSPEDERERRHLAAVVHSQSVTSPAAMTPAVKPTTPERASDSQPRRAPSSRPAKNVTSAGGQRAEDDPGGGGHGIFPHR